MDPPRTSVARRLITIFLTALAAAVGGGAAVGFAVYSAVMANASSTDQWAELGAVIFGGGAGVLVGGVTYVGFGVVRIRRVMPHGERARPTVALLVFPVMLWIGLGAATSVSQPGLAGIPSVVAVAAIVAAAIVGALFIGGAVGSTTAVRWVGPATAIAIVGIAGSVVLQPIAERAELRDDLQPIEGLALVDGRTLDEPLPGWDLDVVYADGGAGTVSVYWNLPRSHGEHARATLRLGRAPLEACDRCVAVATRSDGAPVLHDGYRTWTDFAGSRWHIDAHPRSLRVEDAAAVLARLERADADAFANAASDR